MFIFSWDANVYDRYFDPYINFVRNLKQLKLKFYVNFHVHKHKHTLGIMLNWDEESLAAEKCQWQVWCSMDNA